MRHRHALTAFSAVALSAAVLVGSTTPASATTTETGDAGDTLATAQVVTGPETQITGTLTAGSDHVDMFRITIIDPAAFAASTSGSAVDDTELTLFDDEGHVIEFNDDSDGRWSFLPDSGSGNPYAPATADDYYLAVSSYYTLPYTSTDQSMTFDSSVAWGDAGNSVYGPVDSSYVLHHWFVEDYDYSGDYVITLTGLAPRTEVGDAPDLPPGSPIGGVATISGALTPDDDIDLYAFCAVGGDFSAEVMTFPGDSMLFLFDGLGHWIASDDDGGDGLLSRIDTTLSTGPHLLAMGGYDVEPDNDGDTTTVLTSWTDHEHDSSGLYTIALTGTTPCGTASGTPPVAADDSYTTNEDTSLSVPAPGVLGNDTDADGDTLGAAVVATPTSGTLLSSADGSFTYVPNPDFNGSDTFTYRASDGTAFSNEATVTITVDPVNDPPVVTLDPGTRTVQYSDAIAPITVTVTDVDSGVNSLIHSALPPGLSLTAAWGSTCEPNGDGGETCDPQITGTVPDPGTYGYSIAAFDGTDTGDYVFGTVTVAAEDATVAFPTANPVSVRVDEGEDHASTVTLEAVYGETDDPDAAAGTPAPGDLMNAGAAMRLVPVGPGSPINGACTTPAVNLPTPGYDQEARILCTFTDVPVNTYTVEVTVDTTGYYTGFGEDVLTVYDPDAGFATGGGWFEWPGTGERTNFGFTMKYNKKGTNLQGSLLVIRHIPGEGIYRVKSNALEGLAVGTNDTDGELHGWATFTGKATYAEPGWLEPIGNYEFVVSVTDRNEPGNGTDTFRVQILDQNDQEVAAMTLPSPQDLDGGNIVVPHGGGGKGRGHNR